MSNKLTITDAHAIVSRKILINKMSIGNLEHQVKFSQNSAILQVMTMEDASKKIKLIKQLNDIFEQQLSNFDGSRQNECDEIYSQINCIDTPTDKFKKIVHNLENYEQKMLSMIPKIEYLENTLPVEKMMTNYVAKIEIPSVAESKTAFNCATDTMGFGRDTPPDIC
jgi:hypothetical protein